ncbi:MAG: SPOR domain-containing protein, partial [Arcobacteraceae bacterium]
PEPIAQDKALEGQSIEQEYQRIINERLKKLQEQKEAEQSQTPTQTEQPQSAQEQPTEVQQPVVAEEPVQETPVAPIKETIKESVKQPVVEKKVVQPEPAPKATAPKADTKALFTQTTPTSSTTKTSTTSTSSNLKGFFIQVGAFSKEPSNDFLNKIKSKGYSYKVFKDTVNGVTYNKVLVGPFNSRAEADSNATSVKKALDLNSAFILSF